MKKCFSLLVAGMFLVVVGCEKKLPSGSVDTSDPNKTFGTMTPLQKGSGDPTGLKMPKKGP
ncbi:unnamed protein product [Gemmata massiliana]|uniref:Lipoprotein n=1 Tax=Gemmata massiliana TaxID=1210884 RepID=A0A6P2CPH5_9BACT|nr:hypothetical protein [Gemmata massiliana]VTR90739.1 unnamed protein product [Gemmata massiliana]